MSNQSCSKKAQAVVNLAKKTVGKPSIGSVSPLCSSLTSQSKVAVQNLRAKRPCEATKPPSPKKICQNAPSEDLDDLSLDYIFSDESPISLNPISEAQADLATKVSVSIQTAPVPTTVKIDKSISQPQRLRAPSRDETSTFRKKQLESLPFFRGFKNLGNSCYMNAVLQALLSLSPFQTDLQNFYRDFCKMFGSQSGETEEAVESLPLSIKISSGLIEAFIDIMGQVNAESNTINGFPLKGAVSQREKRFADFRQQDAHEFFLCLLDQISDEVVATMKAANKLSGKQHESKDFCPTTKNFDCLVEHSLTCRQCHDTTRVTELYRDFSLEIPSNFAEPQLSEFKPSLQNLLEAFFSTDEVDRRCEKCGGARAEVTHQILQLPRILVLHLKRFRLDFKRSTYTKITRKVLINPELDISFCCSSRVQSPPSSPSLPNGEGSVSNSSVLFDLHCITHHIGRYATAGHYISDVRVSSRGEDQRWYSYNDTIVTEISANEALNEERESYGYMFFYLLRTNN